MEDSYMEEEGLSREKLFEAIRDRVDELYWNYSSMDYYIEGLAKPSTYNNDCTLYKYIDELKRLSIEALRVVGYLKTLIDRDNRPIEKTLRAYRRLDKAVQGFLTIYKEVDRIKEAYRKNNKNDIEESLETIEGEYKELYNKITSLDLTIDI